MQVSFIITLCATMVASLPVNVRDGPVARSNFTVTKEAAYADIQTVKELISGEEFPVSNLIETSSEQEIQTVKDYLEQLKSDIRGGAQSYVQDSVGMMEELTGAIKELKKKIELTVDRVNTKSESKLLAIKAIEELIGFGTKNTELIEGESKVLLGHSLIETGSVQEIQTIKDYLEQLKTDIRSGASSYVQDSVSMMEELTTAIKDLKAKIEATVDRVNTKSEQKLLAIKAIEELIGYGGNTKGFLQKTQSVKPEDESSYGTPKNLTFHPSLVNTSGRGDVVETHVAGG